MLIQKNSYRGFEVPVEVRGSSAETLVFLPGLGVPPAAYAAGLDALAERFRVVTPDLSFRRGDPLPTHTDDYLALVSDIADDVAPEGVWAGHSFGALLSLLSTGPAIGCAPSVPAEVGLPRMFGRAVRQQLREYSGVEGAGAIGFAARIMVDYVSTAALRPDRIFPTMASLRKPPETFPPRASPAVVFLCERDELYREREYRDYFDGRRIEEVRVPDCHDWPIFQPAALAERVGSAFDRVTRSGARDEAGSAGARVALGAPGEDRA